MNRWLFGSLGMNLHRPVWRISLALLVAGILLVLRHAAAAEKSPREMFPASTVVYAEMPEPQKLIDAVLDHPSVAELQKHPDYQKAFENPQAKDFLKVLGAVEAKLGMKWRPALTSLTGGGIYVAFDLPTLGTA